MDQSELDDLRDGTLERVRAAKDAAGLRLVEKEVLDGRVAEILATIASLPKEDRPRVGKAANQVKVAIQAALEARRAELDAEALAAERSGTGFDPTLPAAPAERGSLHPITRVQREVEDIFLSMGYAILDGPEVELDYYNFEALNFDPDHPAREQYDTIWCRIEGVEPRTSADHLCLRTHTSPVQIRAMERMEPPIRAIAPGRVFRHEQQDASHDHTFHQVEGLVVDEGIHLGHLTGTLKGFLNELFRKELEVRLRPGYFPFVEPGCELDVRCPFCEGCEGGCRVCKKSGWIEFCGCGMVHPNVLRAVNIDPERYTGFAFGFGLDRLVMMRYGVDDIRHFMGGDLRFLEQF
ncbi:MAG: phenylalanine--tRNA ligase subunit alpha [Planctomycetota bacterium]|nr:phenylalanine--tRNA ligase subunit alpha [Planctomycetota bacterium]